MIRDVIMLMMSNGTGGVPFVDDFTGSTITTELPEYLTAVYRREKSDTRVAMLASEPLLAREWNTPQEDDAWAHL